MAADLSMKTMRIGHVCPLIVLGSDETCLYDASGLSVVSVEPGPYQRDDDVHCIEPTLFYVLVLTIFDLPWSTCL
jgi:hypothetical protein